MQKYNKGGLIGRGAAGSVYLLTRNEDGKKFILKEILKKIEEREKKKEVKLLSQMRHHNITEYVEHFEHEGAFCIVMEYADGGDFQDLMNRTPPRGPGLSGLTEEKIMRYFCQICSAVGYLHLIKHTLHRDIKCNNLFLTSDDTVKVGDFGISRQLENSNVMANTFCGTSLYQSPELCNNQPYNFKSDVWALGVLLYYLATNKYPFVGNNMLALAQTIIKGVYESLPIADDNNNSNGFSQDFYSLVVNCLKVNPEDRYDIRQVLSTPIVQGALEKLIQEEINNIPIEEQNEVKKLPREEQIEEIKRIQRELTKKPSSVIDNFDTLCSVSKNALRNVVTEINLTDKDITKENFTEMSKSLLPFCEKLSILRLGGNPDIGDEEVKVFSTHALSKLKCLTELYLDDTSITDEGAAAIANVLPQCAESLSYLSLPGRTIVIGRNAINDVPSVRNGKLKVEFLVV